MKLAIPVENGCLHSHFGSCREFAVVEVDPETKAVRRTETLPAPDHAHCVFPGWLRTQGVQAVIVGEIGRRALELFAQQGITVRAGTPGTQVEELVKAFLDGRLTETPQGCGHHRHPHAHRHGCRDQAQGAPRD